MLSAKAILTALFFGVVIVSAIPIEIQENPLNLKVATKLNKVAVAKGIKLRDQARAAYLRELGNGELLNKRATSPNVAVDNQAVIYVATVGVGVPATDYTLLIDTGSSNTFIGADKTYVKTSTSYDTGDSVSVNYGSGSFSGTEYLDTVTLSSSLVIKKQSIGVANESTGFEGLGDGILGIGPTDLTEDTVSGVFVVPTVTDNLYSQGTISTEVIGISFVPTTEEEDGNGTLTFGGVDKSLYTGSITYVSKTTTYPSSYYWGLNETIKYGSGSNSIILLSNNAGTVDTGTTLTLLADDAFTVYQSATGAIYDDDTGLYSIISAQYSSLKGLYYTIGDATFELTPNAQIWPRSLNTYIGGTSSKIYLIVADLGSTSGQGFDFVNGYTFLERFYSVFDTTNQRIGFANTAHTDATIN